MCLHTMNVSLAQEGLVHFDEGSLVIAFCTGAKLADDRPNLFRVDLLAKLVPRCFWVGGGAETCPKKVVATRPASAGEPRLTRG